MGGGGTLGKITEVATGGLVKSGETKDKIKAAEAAATEQKRLLDVQKAEIAEEEAQRKARIGRTRQGRRSLLYAGGDEAGVTKSTTLGG